jgi:hypothetical protein
MTVKKFLTLFAVFAVAGFITSPKPCEADTFTISNACDATVTSSQGNVDCSTWQKGSKANYKGIDVATCICANTCLAAPANHYYYDDPINKTRQDEKSVKLPVVLAWDEVPGWKKTGGSYVWYWPSWSVGGSDSATSDVFAVRSYLLEIDNTKNDLNDSKSAGGIFRKILTTNEFNAQSLFYPCFFNSATTYRWRVRPCCNADGSNCQPESQSTWWTFTTSAAPEPINPNDPNWNGSGSAAAALSFDGLQIKWCRAYFQETKRFATSYKLNVTSDESGSQDCHPLLKIDGVCQDDDILADPVTGKVYTIMDTDGIPKVPFPTTDQARHDHALFTRNHTYVWKLKSCFDDIAQDCSDYGQAWTFSTRTDAIGIPTPQSPENDASGNKLTSLPVSLSWSMPDGANSFIVETSFFSGERNTTRTTIPNPDLSISDNPLFDADNVAPNTTYRWRVRACSNFNSTNCDGWSGWFSFVTTGRPPKANSLTSTSNIPATFSWEAVEGAKSYNFSLQAAGADPVITVLNNPKMLEKPTRTVKYPDIDQETTYYWKVQTCAHENGTACGGWSAESSITTGEITTPLAASPAEGETITADQVSHQLSWSAIKGSAAYHYVLTLTNPAETNCQQGVVEGITQQTSQTMQMHCLGEYTLAVEACVDAKCQSVSPKGEWAITLAQSTPSNTNSLAVCGTGYDNPDTPWNEREECNPKHAALFVKIFLDFLIFKLSLFLLPFMILITAFLFYSPFGTPDLLEKVKSTWKAIGIGYALLIFAWLIVGIILSIVGFNGLWWKIL